MNLRRTAAPARLHDLSHAVGVDDVAAGSPTSPPAPSTPRWRWPGTVGEPAPVAHGWRSSRWASAAAQALDYVERRRRHLRRRAGEGATRRPHWRGDQLAFHLVQGLLNPPPRARSGPSTPRCVPQGRVGPAASRWRATARLLRRRPRPRSSAARGQPSPVPRPSARRPRHHALVDRPRQPLALTTNGRRRTSSTTSRRAGRAARIELRAPSCATSRSPCSCCGWCTGAADGDPGVHTLGPGVPRPRRLRRREDGAALDEAYRSCAPSTRSSSRSCDAHVLPEDEACPAALGGSMGLTKDPVAELDDA